ncbi:MAG TPA: glycerophosphodiester phosphodiesterase family protein [Rhodothermales bacterium]|nr:glycerophosphodiester phosphodiesterase family protein [Rhodothermales bacterium]
MTKKVGAVLVAAFVAFVYLNNTSHLTDPVGAEPVLLAHRGVAQDFSREGLTGETCTAARMLPTPHEYLENTIPSMQAAFDYGADVVEFDVHRTTDDRFAVFHDWTVDCRTESSGVTREFALDSLQTLDIGYGYTADGGQTYPFRGRGVGLMPSMEEVLHTFPDRSFLIDVKGGDASEGALLADRLAELSPERQEQIMVYGGGVGVSVIRERLPRIRTIWRRRLKQCLIRYAALGWTGYVSSQCERSVVMVPANYAPWLWGWPDRFLQRMEAVGSRVFMIGDYQGEGFSQGFDDPKRLAKLPTDFSGGVWTDRIDLIGPAVGKEVPAVLSDSSNASERRP